MKSGEYWKGRFKQLEELLYQMGVQCYPDIERQYQQALQQIEAKILVWYQRFADNNEISLLEARRLLQSSELKELKWDIKQYIQYGKENGVNGMWMKELENASARTHITRLESLKLQLQQSLEVMFGNQLDSIDTTIRNVYQCGYLHTAYEIQKGVGIGWNLASPNEELISQIIQKPWAADGRNFSERIWTNKQKLVNELNTTMTRNIITGANPQKTIDELARKMNVSKQNAGRLVMTEQAAFSNAAQRDCFAELGVEQFEVVETLDSHTCETCGGRDGKYFPMSEFEIGVTAPPFHPNCRGCTCPYFEDDFGVPGERAARGGNGKIYYVPGNITYEEWLEQYVKSSPEEMVSYAKVKNFDGDKKQYKKYKDCLGKSYVPNTFDEFQNIKYGNVKEYGILKSQYKGMKYYDKATESEPLITSSVKVVAGNSGLETYGLKNRVKGKESYLRKIRAEYNPDGNTYEVKDIIRYTLGSENPDILVERMSVAIAELNEMGYNTIALKNTWNNPKNPYKGINTIVAAPNGQKFEIQYHTRESFETKEKMHKLYEDWRKLEDKTSKEAIKLSKEMTTLSKKLSVPKNIEKVK